MTRVTTYLQGFAFANDDGATDDAWIIGGGMGNLEDDSHDCGADAEFEYTGKAWIELEDLGDNRDIDAQYRIVLEVTMDADALEEYEEAGKVTEPSGRLVRFDPKTAKPLICGDVFAYFTHTLGREPADETLRNLPCDSTCGAECVAAIEAADAFAKHAQAAHGDGAAVVAHVERIISAYWHG